MKALIILIVFGIVLILKKTAREPKYRLQFKNLRDMSFRTIHFNDVAKARIKFSELMERYDVVELQEWFASSGYVITELKTFDTKI